MKSLAEYFLLSALTALCMAAAVMGGSCADGDPEAPAQVLDLHYFQRADALVWNGRVSEGVTAGQPDTRILAWAAPGDDGYDGKASLYDARYFLASDLARLGLPDNGAALVSYWVDARRLSGEPEPKEGGRLAQMFLPRISPGETIWFAMRAVDEIGQEADISNVAGPVHLATLMVPIRPAAGDTAAGFGAALAAAGDVNHDGYGDMLLGSSVQGKAALVMGGGLWSLVKLTRNAGGANIFRAVDELTPRMTISGDTADGFGAAVAGLANVNGDAFTDFAVGAPAYDRGSTVDAGAVFIQYGAPLPPATLPASSVSAVIRGQDAGDRFGQAVAGAGDVNGDGRAEIIAGAPGAFAAGAVYVLKFSDLAAGDAAAASVIIKGEAAGNGFGTVVAAIGDVNGDGVSDLAVGAPLHDEPALPGAGAVYVFYGGDNGVADFNTASAGAVIDLSLQKADVTIRGTAAGRGFGKQIAAGGNLSGDSDAALDFAVSGGDTVYVFFGGGASFPLQGSSVEALDTSASARLAGVPGEQFGSALSGAIDFNRDGNHDLVVGAPGADACYVFNGPVTSASGPGLTLLAPAAGQGFGAAIAAPGDLSSDYFPDLLIAAPDAGQAYLTF